MPKAVESGLGARDDPTPGFLAGFFSQDFFPAGSDVGRVAQGGEYFAHLSRVVARV